MTEAITTELLLIRHAPAITGGRLAGRRDVPADCTSDQAFAALRAALGAVDRRLVSPALRCRQTAAALWPDAAPHADPRLWEQDFGAWEGVPYADLPDLGLRALPDLADHRPPGGESFADQCARTAPALVALATGGRVAVVAHAGTVRAGLALALGAPGPALAFQVAPLSLTRITALAGGGWAVGCVNWTPA